MKPAPQERLRRGEVVGAVSIQPQALPSCLVDQLGALDYLFCRIKRVCATLFPEWRDAFGAA
ncbi:Chromosome initiation inhibitor [Klebsiella pneumoniae]|uniref:Chromosome initiation inhibitor n=1 Tax=Klebsiella pneumoniae TaxID=573 RepID=A0A377V9Q7_KLEPN|nr:Chromosome initiation inhibitor [Klebsiella pneumoniae]